MKARTFRVKSMMIIAILLLCVLLASSGAAPEPHINRIANSSLELSHVTSGIVPADTLIAVRFLDEQVAEKDLHKELRINPFTFTPTISGTAYWEDAHTLVFKPSQPLYKKADYHSLVNLVKVFGQELDTPEPIEFHFATLGQNVTQLTGQFELPKATTDADVQFIASIEFTEKTTIDDVRQALKLDFAGKALSCHLSTTDNLTFTIESDSFMRSELQDQPLTLNLSATPLKMSQDISQEYILTSANSPLVAQRIVEEHDGEYSSLRVIFSDILDPSLDYQGYLHIKPQVDYKVTVDDNCLVVSGKFRPGEQYSVQLFPGIASATGQKLASKGEFFWAVEISDNKPAVEFVSSGMFLPSMNQEKVAFRTMNVARVHVRVTQVTDDNLINFITAHSYRPHSGSYYDYNLYSFQQFGSVIADEIVEVGQEMNQWIQSELDLSQALLQPGALYVVQLDFDPSQVLNFPADYSDWQISDQIYTRGQVVKHLIVSDIGVTAKAMLDNLYVFVADVITTKPTADAVVMLKDESGRVLSSGATNAEGLAQLANDSRGRYIEVHANDNYAILDSHASQLSQSVFDVGGIQKQAGVNAFIYTEQGVYRPGDEINLAAIVRNEDDTFPANHPVTLKIYNPQGRLVSETVNNQATDGFYTFKITTDRTDLTGTWLANLDVGGRKFTHSLRIEEIMPYRISVDIVTAQEQIKPSDDFLMFAIESEYLFGAPASHLTSETTLIVEPYDISFNGYQNFIFGNQTLDNTKSEYGPFKEVLDAGGKAALMWEVPQLTDVPSGLRLRINTQVLESGGRPVSQTKTIQIQHYQQYVGIGKLESSNLMMGQTPTFPVVHLDAAGQPLSGSRLEYTIYRSHSYWWWDYYSESAYRRSFKSDQDLIVLAEGEVTTDSEGFAQITHTLNDYGQILVEVRDPVGGHSAAYFLRALWWGDTVETNAPGIVNLKLDQATYLPGETAYVTLNTPPQGRALITVEKDNQILDYKWEELTSTETDFSIDVKPEYIPNCYISVMIYQPYGTSDNDLPLRIYGIAPLTVINENATLDFNVDIPATVKPQEAFTLKLQTADQLPAQFTIAVVDEGLLGITNFMTPNPGKHFYDKQRLVTRNYDNYSDVIGLTSGYIHNLLSVGGDYDEGLDTYRQSQLNQKETQIFESVSQFYGPVETDANGYGELEITLPNYIGNVRVMVVATRGGSYGSSTQNITVKLPLMTMPTLPRALGPEDRISIPVTVFAMEDQIGEVKIRLDVSGPVRKASSDEVTIRLETAGQKEVFFQLAAANAVGVADITVSVAATDHDYTHASHYRIPVRAQNPYLYLSEQLIVDPGQQVTLRVPKGGVSGTDQAQLVLSPFKGLNINHRLEWLVRYPYGCLEQTTSAVFPQLYLPELFNFDAKRLAEIDTNINAAIQGFQAFQLKNGGFAYWAGNTTANAWATNYVGHFLLEARQKGYHVPNEMLANWLQFQQEQARSLKGNTFTRVYRLYVLAVAGEPNLSAMNYMRESELAVLSNPEKYLLAAAYHVAGFAKISEQILAASSMTVATYLVFDDTYGSSLRDQAMILDVLTQLGRYSDAAVLYNEIADRLASAQWYSTQTTSYSLMALTKYVSALSAESEIKGDVILANLSSMSINTKDTVSVTSIPNNRGQDIAFTNTATIPLFATLEWEGIPLKEDLRAEQNGLILQKCYYDTAGKSINIGQLKQGDSFYMVLKVRPETAYERITDLALVQILPAGWEIENTRLIGGSLPEWTNIYNLGHEEYLDIRDDRIMWFFDLDDWLARGKTVDFIVKINVVTLGEFYLPPTLLEAMYNNDYKVVTEGRMVRVVAK